jgi:hypothetical protein
LLTGFLTGDRFFMDSFLFIGVVLFRTWDPVLP